MQTALAAEVGRLVDWGWHVESHTDTTASLETRGPFNWLIFALLILLFPFVGGLLYVAFWLIVSRANVFLRVEDGAIIPSGDTWFVDMQAAEAQASRRLAVQIKTQGFWKTMGPSIVSVVAGIALWILLVWALVQLLD
jgi:hypothetical protein